MSIIRLNLSLAEARAVLKLLNGPSSTSETLADVFYRLEDEINSTAPSAPWRKVVDRRWVGHALTEYLECGHSVHHNGNKAVDRAHAKRRRCQTCGGK